ncbi:hypothetical protein HII31_06928 [Pseudocercospora fuligena]|uniref:Suppressor of anucleate metulae protein B n=1 Tax=Pseudocercospora fuligena TaxID=685502 RepID=A0A8H6RIU1_9PEZI|nr:hypothetical protein HII31_06928 [Pseudocercospora fuligena]
MADVVTDSLAAMSLEDRCKACAKPTPLPALICFKCSEGKSSEGTSTYIKYCSVQCRTADQDEHAQHCKNQNVRKAIYRAGGLLKGAFHQMRLRAFDLKIASVEKKDGILYFKDDDYYGRDEFPFYNFPADTVKDQEDVQALLSYAFCNDAPVFLDALAKKALEGLASSIEQAVLQISAPCKVRRIFPSGDVVPDVDYHSVMGIDGYDGQSYIIDTTGAQHGQFKAVVPLRSYIEQNDARVRKMYYAGGPRVAMIKQIKATLEKPDSDPRGSIGLFKLATALNRTVQEWEDRNQTSIGKLLQSDKKTFTEGKKQLIHEIGVAMSIALKEIYEETDVKKTLDWLYDPAGQGAKDSGATTNDDGRMSCMVTNKVEGSGLYKMWVAQNRADLQAPNPHWWKTKLEPHLAAGGNIKLAWPSQGQAPA